jgi:hypothetical protein
MLRQRSFHVGDVRWTVFLVEAPRLKAMIPEALRGGWLCFESSSAKRRLAPVPLGWDDLDDEALRSLLVEASPVSAAGRNSTA